MKATTGEEFVAAVLANGIDAMRAVGDVSGLLREGVESEAWALVCEHVSKYGVLPKPETVEKEVESLHLPKTDEPPGYYRDRLRRRFTQDKIAEAVDAAKEKLKFPSPDPDAAYDAMTEILMEVATVRGGDRMADARGMGEAVYHEIKTMLGSNKGVALGWDYFDYFSGGLRPGDLVSFIGRPAGGKTFLMLYAARHAWVEQGKRVLFVSMEMESMQILMRMAGLESKIEARDVRTGHVSTKQQQQIRELIFPGRPSFHIVDGNLAATPRDTLMTARQLQPDVIFVDGAYLMRHHDPKLGFYTRVSAVCEELKRMAGDLSVPVVTSWQFSRAASKKKKGEAIGLEDIAYSDVIGQLSSVVLGLFEDDSIETQARRRVQILKGRAGEQGEFLVRWDFKNMDFSQATAVTVDKESAGEKKGGEAEHSALGLKLKMMLGGSAAAKPPAKSDDVDFVG